MTPVYFYVFNEFSKHASQYTHNHTALLYIKTLTFVIRHHSEVNYVVYDVHDEYDVYGVIVRCVIISPLKDVNNKIYYMPIATFIDVYLHTHVHTIFQHIKWLLILVIMQRLMLFPIK